MAKKKQFDFDMVFKIAIVVVLVLILMKVKNLQPNQESVIVINQSILQLLENPPANPLGVSCEIQFSDYYVEVGDTISGTIIDGANQQCYVYYHANANPWELIAVVTLGSNGRYSASRMANTAGTAYFAAICGNCITEMEQIVVTAPETPPSQSACTDTDDGNNLLVKGTCTDAVKANTDTCPLGNGAPQISEAYCSGDVCMGVSTYCPDGYVCEYGECVVYSEPDCNSNCNGVGYELGGYYSGGVSCDDFEHWLSGPQCCCYTPLSASQDLQYCTQILCQGSDWYGIFTKEHLGTQTCEQFAHSQCTAAGLDYAGDASDSTCCCFKCD